MLFEGFLWLNIAAITLLGISSAYTDLHSGKIPNRAVFPAIFVAIALNFLNSGSWNTFIVNGALAFLFGFVLFLGRLWSAADSKLFLAFALLFPISLYGPDFMFFPSFAIILNAFIPAFFGLFIFALIRTSREQKLAALKSTFHPKTVAGLAIVLFAFYWLLFLFFSALRVPLDFFIIVLLLFFFVAAVELVFPEKFVFVCAAISAFFLWFCFAEASQPGFAANFFIILAVMLVLRFFVLHLGFFSFGVRKELRELKPGMVVLEGVYEKNGLLEKKKLFFPSLVNVMQDIQTNYVIDLSVTGLREQDIEMLKQAKKDQRLMFHSLLVQETLPFAPILFLGVLISLACPAHVLCFLSL
ncbi:MAG: hypothetical protein JW744_02735 [Candidatus Diapherotrites archaeon]|uniref:Prepilin type IV endopeptidase peptidase domain-containing protein n=1 Tax=Candidatus Iainarchaeum sp. TaxID=3101447 RepID=A0A938YND2_9ARCH|nr:hypothetical protein [Candidatus Diapherotrites archaeon]